MLKTVKSPYTQQQELREKGKELKGTNNKLRIEPQLLTSKSEISISSRKQFRIRKMKS